jgi:hypothetical protein
VESGKLHNNPQVAAALAECRRLAVLIIATLDHLPASPEPTGAQEVINSVTIIPQETENGELLPRPPGSFRKQAAQFSS